MDKLLKQIRAEEENVEIALGNLKQTIEREEKTVIELAWGARMWTRWQEGRGLREVS